MILGINGRKGSGKDTFAEMFIKEAEKYSSVPFERLSFASPIKNFVSDVTGASLEQLEDREFKESDLPHSLQNRKKGITTYRNLMQVFGTESVRDVIRKDFWVKVLLSKINAAVMLNGEIILKNYVITDVRFENEFDALKSKGAVLVKIDRGISGDGHASEKEIGREFDKVVLNHGSLDDLREKSRDLAGNLRMRGVLR